MNRHDKAEHTIVSECDVPRSGLSCTQEGFKEAAEKFRMESGIEPTVDLDSLDERIKIREMILKGQIQEAIALINSLHPELLDTNRYLYFHLQVHLHATQCKVSETWIYDHARNMGEVI